MYFDIKQLNKNDVDLLVELIDCFALAFDDHENYKKHQPSAQYLSNLLDSEAFIVLVAVVDEKVMGGLVSYELKKFEQERSEIYIYDLAVAENYRRKGVATHLINELKPIALQKNAWVVYVQADHDDKPAKKLYAKLGVEERVSHFDIPVHMPNEC